MKTSAFALLLALIRLHHATGEPRYLELARRFFLNQRGHPHGGTRRVRGPKPRSDNYNQDRATPLPPPPPGRKRGLPPPRSARRRSSPRPMTVASGRLAISVRHRVSPDPAATAAGGWIQYEWPGARELGRAAVHGAVDCGAQVYWGKRVRGEDLALPETWRISG